MTEKKMRKWLKTFIMLLPVVFVVLFGVHLHRHDLPASIVVDGTTYTEPLQVIAGSFNNYIDMYTSNTVFNIGEFYDWSVDTFFEGTAPLYYKPIFSIMVYEFVVELLFLMFSFITFIIRFAQKWIDGLYERRF